MGISTTTVNACDASIWIDDANGTLKDASGSTNSVSISISQNVGEQRVFGSRWPYRQMCGRDVSLDITVVYSTAADEGLDLLRDWILSTGDPNIRTVTIYLPDKNVGSDKYTGEFVLESLDIPATAGEAAPMLASATLLINGAFTHTNVAT